MGNEALTKIIDTIKESLETGMTPNYLFVTHEFYTKLIDIYDDFWNVDRLTNRTFTGRIGVLSGMTVYVVSSLPENHEVIAVYIKPQSCKESAKDG